MAVSADHPSYRSVLSHRRLAGLLAGDAISKIGDGMVVVALPLQALRLHGTISAALAIALVEAAPYPIALALSAVFGLGRRRFAARRVLLGDCCLRGATFTGLTVLALTGRLGLGALAGLLFAGSGLRLIAASSRRLVATAMAGQPAQYTVNSLLGVSGSLATYVLGPVLGGLVASAVSPAAVFAVDAATFAVLFGTVMLALGPQPHRRTSSHPKAASGWQILRRNPVVTRLFAAVLMFNLLYMPVGVALPLLVRGPLHAGGAALGEIWTAFGVGALAGATATNRLRRLSQLQLSIGIIGGWGLCVAVLAAAPNVAVATIAFAVGGTIYAPFTPIAYSLLQANLAADEQQPVLTVWAAGVTVASPLGLVLGGPLVQATGTRGGLYVSAALTALLVPITTTALHRAKSRQPTPQTGLSEPHRV